MCDSSKPTNIKRNFNVDQERMSNDLQKKKVRITKGVFDIKPLPLRPGFTPRQTRHKPTGVPKHIN